MYRFQDILYDYLGTTTIHGLTYLMKSKNLLEKLLWSLIILGCMVFSGLLIHQALHEAQEHPISTTVELVPLTSVPFPAVTIDSDPNLNLWGFTQKMYNLLAFYSPENEGIEKQSKALKSDFAFVGESMASDMWEQIKDDFK